MSRHGRFAAAFVLCSAASPVFAQEAIEGETAAASPPETIDLLIPVEEGGEEATIEYERCEKDAEAARIRGEIVVCRKPRTDTAEFWDQEAWEKRYAEKTKFKDDPPPVPVNVSNLMALVGVSVSIKGCFVPPCPTPMPDLIDVEGLPEAPPGSDADRIGRGLAPRGRDMATPDVSEDALDLPPPPDFAGVSPEGSGAPEGEP